MHPRIMLLGSQRGHLSSGSSPWRSSTPSHTLRWAQLQHPPLRRTGQNTGVLYMATEPSASPEDARPQAVAGGKGWCPQRGGSQDTPVHTGLLPDREV